MQKMWLEEASCLECADITKRFEGKTLQNWMDDTRISTRIKGKRRKRKPKLLATFPGGDINCCSDDGSQGRIPGFRLHA